MTDERMGDGLWDVLERMPRGSGIVFRHYSLLPAARRALFIAIARVARRRHLVLVRAGTRHLRGEQGIHGRIAQTGRGIRTWPAHNPAEIIAGQRAGADLIFISPIFPTRSHVDARPLGLIRAAKLARLAPGKAIALGGVRNDQHRLLRRAGFIGHAAIDGWTAN